MSVPVRRRFASASNIDKLRAAAKAQASGFKKDERFWKLTADKSGNGRAVIRFLPPKFDKAHPDLFTNETDAWVKYWHHSFKSPAGTWFIEKCPTTLIQGEEHTCPVCDLNHDLHAAGEKDTVTKQKRKVTHVSNILVVKDPGAPANEGKVFLFNYGVKLYQKLQEKFQPEDASDEVLDPFDPYEGANFKLKQKQVAGFANYDDSAFEGPSQIAGGDDDAIEVIMNGTHELKPLVAQSEFKSYADLKTKLDRTLKTGSGKAMHAPQMGVSESAEAETDLDTAPPPPQPVRASKASGKVSAAPKADDDDTARFFENMDADD